MHLHSHFETLHLARLQMFCDSNWIWKFNKRLQSRKHPTHQCTKMSHRESSCSLMKLFWNHPKFTIWSSVYTLPLRILLKPWTLWFWRNIFSAKIVSQLNCRNERKMIKFTLQLKHLLPHFFNMELGHIVGSYVGKEFGVMLRGKIPHKPGFAYGIVFIHCLKHYTDLIEHCIVATQKFPCCGAFLQQN